MKEWIEGILESELGEYEGVDWGDYMGEWIKGDMREWIEGVWESELSWYEWVNWVIWGCGLGGYKTVNWGGIREWIGGIWGGG